MSQNLESFSGTVKLNSASLLAWMKSDKAIMSQYPNIGACSIVTDGLGPPAIKVPVSALTATTTTTVIGSSHTALALSMPLSTATTTSAARTFSSHLPVTEPSSMESHSAFSGRVGPHSTINTEDFQASHKSESSALSNLSQVPSTDKDLLSDTSTQLHITGQETNSKFDHPKAQGTRLSTARQAKLPHNPIHEEDS